MRTLKFLYLILGFVLLGIVLYRVNLQEAWSHTTLIGAAGMLTIVALYGLAFLLNTVAWQLALIQVPLNGTWLFRAFCIRSIVEMFNTVLPAAEMGGEPLKAVS